MERWRRAAIISLVVAGWVVTSTGPAAATELVELGHFGQRPPLAEGRFEIEVLSTRAATVTGGDALIAVHGLTTNDEVTVEAAAANVTDRFAFDEDGRLVGLVDGLAVGTNDITVTAVHPRHGARTATLPVDNHPITGPVFSGPHQEPFYCRTADVGLGEPIDDDCSIETQAEWRYYSTATQGFRPLEDPYSSYPADTATTTTTTGETVPYVVRIESSTINRGITRIALLDDPAARGPDAPFEPGVGWNQRVLFQWGQSCGVGYHQGVNFPEYVLTADHYTRELVDQDSDGRAVATPPVGDGYIVVHSTLTTLGTHCNEVLSAETFLMIREHLIERYGEHRFVMGTGASGGAIQQITTANSYPGILDGAIPMVSFPDVVTTAMSPTDCRLLLRVFDADPVRWTEPKIQAVTGLRSSQICRDWDLLFADVIRADVGCDAAIPEDEVYDPETNPDGIRCTVQDSARNVLGTDPETGFARLPLDNVGVQYGLRALQEGAITIEDFLVLNEQVGGYDQDGMVVDARTEMSSDLARRLYEHGRVTGRGALDEVPILHINTYMDVVPLLDIHDQVRAYMLRQRLDRTYDAHDNQVMWNGAPIPQDAFPVMDAWLTALEDAEGSRSDAVVTTKPDGATDRCTLPAGAGIDTEAEEDGACEQLFAPLATPRIVGGGPSTEDIVKCQLAVPERADYGVTFTDEQWTRLTATFPTGVCDWDRPGVGEVQRSRTWLSYGSDTLLAEPVEIPHVVARSTPLATGTEPGAGAIAPLPTTGAGAGLLGLTLMLLVLAGARRRDRRDLLPIRTD